MAAAFTPTPTLIYCANGNKRFADIAAETGFKVGAQLPGTVYHPVYFADQDWKTPNRAAYMASLAVHRPVMATVLDWERCEELPLVLDWADEASAYVQYVVVIPKVVGGIDRIPRTVNGKSVVLGYSVPTKYGATPCVWWEFEGREIHLLGGSPHAQMREWDYLRRVADVVSVDGNMANKMAMRCKVWTANTPKLVSEHRHWPSLEELDGERWGADAPYEAFRRSCLNISREWGRVTS